MPMTVPRNGEAHHQGELEEFAAGEPLADDQIGCEEADGRRQRCRYEGDLHRRPEGVPGNTRPGDAPSRISTEKALM
jgi:hypothetical protein